MNNEYEHPEEDRKPGLIVRIVDWFFDVIESNKYTTNLFMFCAWVGIVWGGVVSLVITARNKIFYSGNDPNNGNDGNFIEAALGQAFFFVLSLVGLIVACFVSYKAIVWTLVGYVIVGGGTWIIVAIQEAMWQRKYAAEQEARAKINQKRRAALDEVERMVERGAWVTLDDWLSHNLLGCDDADLLFNILYSTNHVKEYLSNRRLVVDRYRILDPDRARQEIEQRDLA